jgi:hypothetical protein
VGEVVDVVTFLPLLADFIEQRFHLSSDRFHPIYRISFSEALFLSPSLRQKLSKKPRNNASRGSYIYLWEKILRQITQKLFLNIDIINEN